MDGAILIVGGDDGVMPQTREHLLLAKQVKQFEIQQCETFLALEQTGDPIKKQRRESLSAPRA